MQDSVNHKFAFNDLVHMPTPMQLGGMRRFYLREARNARGLSQAQLAELVGLSDAQLSRIERGESQPALNQIFDLAEQLGVGPTELITGEFVSLGDPPAPTFTITDVRDLIAEAEDYIESEEIEFSPTQRAEFYKFIMDTYAKRGEFSVGVFDTAAAAAKK